MRRQALGSVILICAGCIAQQPPANAPTTEERDVGVTHGRLTDSIGQEMSDLSSRIVTMNASADRDLRLKARVEVQPDELLEFYEIQPGIVMLSGAGAPASPLEYDENLDVQDADDLIALWHEIALGAPMPEELSAAVDRVRQRTRGEFKRARVPGEVPAAEAPMAAPDRVPAVTVPEGGKVTATSQAAAGGFCSTGYYTSLAPSGYRYTRDVDNLGDCPGFFEWQSCWDNVFGDSSSSHPDAWIYRGNVCPRFGSVLYQVEADEWWVTKGSWTIPEDSFRWQATTDSGCAGDPFNDCVKIKASVKNAANSIYNLRYMCLTG